MNSITEFDREMLLDDYDEIVANLSAALAQAKLELDALRVEHQRVRVCLAQSNQLQSEKDAEITRLQAQLATA